MAMDPMHSRWKYLEPCLLLIVAFAVRAAWIGGVAVEHFDEGVYASGYFSELLGYQYQDQHLYAPPLFPEILRSVLFYSGGNSRAVAWVNVVLGTLLVGAVWWVAKDWFGQPAAFMAGIVWAMNEFAIVFSRTMLTDTLLCLWLTLGVWAGWKAITVGGERWIVVAGGLAALAWWTKYNGWLTLAITGSALAGLVVFERPARETAKVMFWRWLATALVAGLLWSPWLWMLQSRGGYAAVAANHAGYFGGPGHWWTALQRQVEVERYFSTGLRFSGLGVLIGWVYTLKRDRFQWQILMLVASRGSVAISGYFRPLIAFAISTLARVLPNSVSRPFTKSGPLPYGFWPACAWGMSLLVAVPLYRPYPRLLLPALIGLLLLSVCSLEPKFLSKTLAEKKGLYVSVLLGAVLICLNFLGFATKGNSSQYDIWVRRTGFLEITPQLLRDTQRELQRLPASTRSEASCIMYVLGEPGLYFHLAAARGRNGQNHVAYPSANLGMLAPGSTEPGVPTFLITSLHAHRDHPELMTSPPERLHLVHEYLYRPSDVVLLDDVAPAALKQHRVQFVRLWRIE